MPHVHFVKKARKDNKAAGIKAGDSYYWWANRMKGAKSGIKRYSKTRPRPSQTTMSEYWSAAYSAQESVDDALAEFRKAYNPPEKDNAAGEVTAGEADAELAAALEDLKSVVEGVASEVEALADETRGKFDNMPDGLQQGDTGQLLEQRADACERIKDELEDLANRLDPTDADDALATVEELESFGWDFE